MPPQPTHTNTRSSRQFQAAKIWTPDSILGRYIDILTTTGSSPTSLSLQHIPPPPFPQLSHASLSLATLYPFFFVSHLSQLFLSIYLSPFSCLISFLSPSPFPVSPLFPLSPFPLLISRSCLSLFSCLTSLSLSFSSIFSLPCDSTFSRLTYFELFLFPFFS